MPASVGVGEPLCVFVCRVSAWIVSQFILTCTPARDAIAAQASAHAFHAFHARTHLAELLHEEEDGQEARERQKRVHAEEAAVGDEPDARGKKATVVEAHGLTRVGEPRDGLLVVEGVPEQDHEHAQHAHGVEAEEGARAGRGHEPAVVLAEGEAARELHDQVVAVVVVAGGVVGVVTVEPGDAGVVAVLCGWVSVALGGRGRVDKRYLRCNDNRLHKQTSAHTTSIAVASSTAASSTTSSVSVTIAPAGQGSRVMKSVRSACKGPQRPLIRSASFLVAGGKMAVKTSWMVQLAGTLYCVVGFEGRFSRCMNR